MNKEDRSVALYQLKDPVILLAFGFGSGLLSKAPGTFGTLSAIPIFVLISDFDRHIYILVLAILALAGIWICGYAAKQLAVHDHPGIVWDEIVGYLFTMAAGNTSTQSIAAGFVFFRIFDIFKPWPIAIVDKKVEGGLGIMLDDILAGIYAAVCLALFAWLMAKV